MNARRLLQRTALLLALTCIARGAPHDFASGFGTSPGGPNDPNGQGPCHNGSAKTPDASGDSDPVDLFRGELILDRRDVFVLRRGLSIDLTFHYRSQSKENGQFGYGWTFSYSRRIRKLDNGNAVLLQGTNNIQEFTAAAGGGFTSPAGNYSTLQQNGDGTFTSPAATHRRRSTTSTAASHGSTIRAGTRSRSPTTPPVSCPSSALRTTSWATPRRS